MSQGLVRTGLALSRVKVRKEEKRGEENLEEKGGGVFVNHHFEVASQRHEGKYQRFILARTWTRLIKDGTFDD